MNHNGASHLETDVALFLQDLSGGGAEKIMTSLANEFVRTRLKG